MVDEWVKRMTEDVLGKAPLEIGHRYQHPTDGQIEVIGGQYWGEHGLSNHWTWRVLATGEIKSGYGEPWPFTKSELAARMRHPSGKRLSNG
jgi:hypothetical protein